MEGIESVQIPRIAGISKEVTICLMVLEPPGRTRISERTLGLPASPLDPRMKRLYQETM